MALLKKYYLFDEYNDLVRAVRSGNLARFFFIFSFFHFLIFSF